MEILNKDRVLGNFVRNSIETVSLPNVHLKPKTRLSYSTVHYSRNPHQWGSLGEDFGNISNNYFQLLTYKSLCLKLFENQKPSMKTLYVHYDTELNEVVLFDRIMMIHCLPQNATMLKINKA